MDLIKFLEDHITSNFLNTVPTNFTWFIFEYLDPYHVRLRRYTVCRILILFFNSKVIPIRIFSSPYFPTFGLNTRHTEYLSVCNPNAGKYGQEILRIRTLFMK